MKPLRLVACAGLLACLPTAHAQTAKQADTFVRQIYRAYEHPSKSDPDVLGKQAASFFSPHLLALIRKGEKATPSGDVGKLDFDPLCACQDTAGIKMEELHIAMQGTGKALATVMLFFPEPAKIQVRLSLLWTPQGWRISDIGTKDVPSLRKLLESPGD
jgi:hypothetical protein